MLINNLIKNMKKYNINYILQHSNRHFCDKKTYKLELYQKNKLIVSLKIPSNDIKCKTCNKNEIVSDEIKKNTFGDFFRGYKHF